MNVSVRALTGAEAQALSAARINAVEFAPFFAAALFSTRPVAAEGLGTFAVDRHWRLYVDPETLAAWGPRAAGAVLVHEVSHLVREHADRAGMLGQPFDAVRWNLATDAAINDDLYRVGVPLPGGGVTPAGLGLPENGTEETYYAALPEQPGDGGGCGSGAGDPAPGWELPADDADSPAVSDARIALVRHQTAEAITHAAGRGDMPAGLARWADAYLTTPPLPWRSILARTVRRSLALTRGAVTYTYTRPGRRRLPGIITPALRAPRVRVAAVVDTSASMSGDDLAAALREVSGVAAAVGAGIDVITCDAHASQGQSVRRGADVTLTGGGGTDMRVGIDAALAGREGADVVVVLTDGFTPWPAVRLRVPLVVVLIGDGAATGASVPSWARVVRAA